MEITLPHHPYQRASIKNTFKTSFPPHPRKTTAGQYYWTVATHRNNPRPVSIASCGSSRAEKSPSFPCLPPPSHAPTSTHQKLSTSNHRAKSQYLGARKQLAIHAPTLSFTTRTKVFTTQSQVHLRTVSTVSTGSASPLTFAARCLHILSNRMM